MFQILTACCVLFACLKMSPLLAIIGTVVGTPAIIRTGIASDLHKQTGKQFGWLRRALCFFKSVAIEIAIGLFAFLIFALISILFGGIAVGFAVPYGAVLGAAGGMIWGLPAPCLFFGRAAPRKPNSPSISRLTGLQL